MKVWILAAAFAVSGAIAHAQSPGTDDPVASLAGVWSSRAVFGPELSGSLRITREGQTWRARVGDNVVASDRPDFTFPEGRGAFHGALLDHGRRMQGWWIQPPGLPGQAYATPVRLAARGRDEWFGMVTPLPQTFTLFMTIARNDQGPWTAAFRNPEFNMNAGASRLLANRNGAAITFSKPNGPVVREGALSNDQQHLRLAWPPAPQPLDLQRATSGAPDRYLPRAPGPYVVASPPRTGDGWRTARPRDAGFDEAALAALVQRIIDADPAAQRPSLIHSLLVSRHGRLVLEEYFHGYDRDTPHDIRSAGKTTASAMLGAAMHQGVRLSPQTRLYDVLAAQGPFANPDPRKTGITLAHLMTHTSGLDCNDNDDESRGNEGAMQGQSAQPDWWRFALDLPLAHDPGARYAYCTAGTNLVGAVLHAATGETVPALFDRLIARPLDFGLYHWNLMPSGDGYLGGGAYLRPRDLLKLGQLYLDGGVWNGRRVLDRDWVAQSTAAHVEINEATTGMDAETFANVATHGADGYGWHRYGVRAGATRVEAFEANGNGGQFLVVVPTYDLVVVLNGGNYGQGGIWTRWRDEIVGDAIIAAIRR